MYRIVAICFLFLMYCNQSVVPVDDSFESVHYSYTLSEDLQSLVNATFVVNSRSKDSLTLILPPVYADNPHIFPKAQIVKKLIFTDVENYKIKHRIFTIEKNDLYFQCVTIPCTSDTILMSYSLNWENNQGASGPYNFVSENNGYLQGNYIFAIPYETVDLPHIWRVPRTITTSIDIPRKFSLYGTPHKNMSYRNFYELLFMTTALNGTIIEENNLFRFVSLHEKDTTSAELYTKSVKNLHIMYGQMKEWFPWSERYPFTVILGMPTGGGHEGMNGFVIKDPISDDPNGWYPLILAHEYLHFWIGVRSGDYDDPWWKEGVTSYLAYIFTIRSGLSKNYFIKTRLEKNLENDMAVNTVTLSSELARYWFFNEEKKCNTLLYDKGAQIAMLIDYELRTQTDNTFSLENVIVRVLDIYEGRGFTRTDFLGLCKDEFRTDLTKLFKEYVDHPGFIEVKKLRTVTNKLKDYGVFTHKR